MKRPVVLLHGAFCGGWAMEGFARAFASAGHECLCPDMRHHGMGDKRDLDALGFTSTRDYAADMRTLIDGLPARPIIVGHSMGGLIAQMLAAEGRAEALVLLAPSAPWGVLPSHWREMTSGFGLFLANGNYWGQALIPVYEAATEVTLGHLAEAERRRVFSRFVPESGRAMFEILSWWLDPTRASDVPAAAVDCPVLCVAGSADELNPPETVKRIASRYANARYTEYPDRGHWIIGETGWERVASDALAWVRDAAEAA